MIIPALSVCCVSAGNNTFSFSLKYLARSRIFSKATFRKRDIDIYHDYVEEEALITHSSAYDCVARMLKRMRTFEGGDAMVNQLLREYRDTYKRRKI